MKHPWKCQRCGHENEWPKDRRKGQPRHVGIPDGYRLVANRQRQTADIVRMLGVLRDVGPKGIRRQNLLTMVNGATPKAREQRLCLVLREVYKAGTVARAKEKGTTPPQTRYWLARDAPAHAQRVEKVKPHSDDKAGSRKSLRRSRAKLLAGFAARPGVADEIRERLVQQLRFEIALVEESLCVEERPTRKPLEERFGIDKRTATRRELNLLRRANGMLKVGRGEQAYPRQDGGVSPHWTHERETDEGYEEPSTWREETASEDE